MMVVGVKVRLRALKGNVGEVIESTAVLNAGYESAEEETTIPVKAAVRLGLWPKLPEGTEVEEYGVVGGIKVRTCFIKDRLEVEIITEDGTSKPIRTAAVIMEGQNEILLSNASISAYKIVIENAKEGLGGLEEK